MRLAAALVAILALAGCSQEWRGFVYPNRNDLSEWRAIGPFRSLEECRAASLDLLRDLVHSPERRGDYECGLNCRPTRGLNVCDRTER